MLNPQQIVISIHNQETFHENQYFIDKTGGFSDFFSSFNFDDSQFKPIGNTSIHYTLQNIRSDQPVLFIHNTEMTKEDIQLAKQKHDNPTLVTCANANLYIENQLPNYKNWIDENVARDDGHKYL